MTAAQPHAAHRRATIGLIAVSLAAGVITPHAVAAEEPGVVDTHGGGRIAFQRAVVDVGDDGSFGMRVDGISVMDLDGTDRIDLTDPEPGAWDIGPAWSPDGRMLAFTRQVDGDRVVSLLDPESGVVTPVAPGIAPTWSPTGAHLAWIRPSAGGGGASDLVIAPVLPAVDGRHVDADLARVLTTADGLYRPSWSALGAQISFLVERVVDDPNAGSDLWVVDILGQQTRQLTRDLRVSKYHSPSWSPASNDVAFIVSEPSGSGGYIEAAHLVSASMPGDVTRLREAGKVAWSPDGRFLALSHSFASSSGLLIVHPSGDVVHQGPVDGLSGVGTVQWAASGRHLLVHGHTSTDSPPDLYRIGVDGSVLRLTDDHTVAPDGLTTVSPGVTVRLFGDTRITTAVSLSRQTLVTAPTVVIARADTYADALVAGPLAASLHGPVLLVDTHKLHPAVAAEVRRLEATSAVIVGGPEAVSNDVVASLAAVGVSDVRRVLGHDRFAVAASVAGELGSSHAFVVEGINADPARGWPDAVSVSGLASLREDPILLVGRDEVPLATQRALKAEGITEVTIIGGTAAVSSAVEDEIAELGIAVRRLFGADRYATSAVIAQAMVDSGLDATEVVAASGRDWPDAVTAGPNLAAGGLPVLLVDGRQPRETAATDWLTARAGTIDRLHVAGGRAAVSPSVSVDLEQRVALPTG